MYVDVIALHVIRTSKQVVATLVSATGRVIRLLGEELFKALSRRGQWATEGKGKTEVAVADPCVDQRIRTSMRRMGVQIKPKATHLGIPFRPSAKTQTPALNLSR